MIELLSGQIVYVWMALDKECNLIGYYLDEDEAEEASEYDDSLQSARLNKPRSLRALRQTISSETGEAPVYNYYVIEKIEISDSEAIKRNALAKLSDREKKALGLI
jgi:hypothetical protein